MKLGFHSFILGPITLKGTRLNHLFFYALFFFGGALFSGIRTSLLMTLLILFLNMGIQPLFGDMARRLGYPGFFLIQSLFSLGLFPILWLAAVLVAGPSYFGILSALLLLIAIVGFFLTKNRPVPAGKMPFELIFVILLVLLTTYLPFSHVGKSQPQGLAYRAYFSSDYLKHFSVVEAMNKGKLPPSNPYFEGENLHYYWLVYATPAFLAKLTGSVPQAMFSWSFAINFLFFGTLLLLLQKVCTRSRSLAYFLAVASLTVSLEGLYFLIQKCGFGLHKFLAVGSEYNIDALTRWLWNLPQIDTLLRSMLYTPQHLMAISLLLVFFLALFLDCSRPLLLSSIMAMTLAASFFIGGLLLLTWLVNFLVREVRLLLSRKNSLFLTVKRGVAYFLFPLLALALFLVLRMAETGWRSEFFFQWLSLRKVALLLFLNLGPLLLTGLAGAAGALGRFPARFFHLTLFLLSLLAVLFVRIRGFENDLSLKLGLVLIVQLAFFTALLFEKFRLRGALAAFLVFILIIPGMLTLVLDVYNSADVTNRKFTFYLTEEEKGVLSWIRQNTPAAAVVQTFPPAREENVSIIPSFAGRNMFVGDRMHGRIFQVDETMYNKRLEVLKQHLQNLPSSAPELKKMGLDYLFWGRPELRYFGAYPPLKKAFSLGDTALYSLE